jgi:hypothetical protein
LVERGVPLAQVPDLRGHALFLTTERYAIRGWKRCRRGKRRETGKTFSPARRAADDSLENL